MKTRDRILITSLDAFSEYGVGQISTNHIADIMDISPGNLHYHFKSKQAIISELYQFFAIDFNIFMKTGERKISTPQEMFLVMSLSYQLLVKYRFIFRDASFTNSKYPELKRSFSAVVRKTRDGIDAFCLNLQKSGLIEADERELQFLSNSLHLMFTQWVGYVDICRHGGEERRLTEAHRRNPEDPFYIAQGVTQMAQFLMPYMTPDVRASFEGVEPDITALSA